MTVRTIYNIRTKLKILLQIQPDAKTKKNNKRKKYKTEYIFFDR